MDEPQKHFAKWKKSYVKKLHVVRFYLNEISTKGERYTGRKHLRGWWYGSRIVNEHGHFGGMMEMFTQICKFTKNKKLYT